MRRHSRHISRGSISAIATRAGDTTAVDGLPSPQSYDFNLIEERSSQDSQDAESLLEKLAQPKDEPVTWMSLPRKDQLAILFLCRFVDFLQVASLQAYVFYQLKSFDEELSDAQISGQAGLLQGAFTGAQVLTAILWGKAADASWCGRKLVLVIGLFGTALSCIGYGFSSSFYWAIFWRAFGGSINGLVGIIRTMISEITVERKYQSRAFLILPMSFNVAGILGPMMGGWLADPTKALPDLFGEGAPLHCSLIVDFPFALPSIMNAVALALTGLAVVFGLEETSVAKRDKFDAGLHLWARFMSFVTRRPMHEGYSKLEWNENTNQLQTLSEKLPVADTQPKHFTHSLPFSRIWTRNVIFTLVAAAFYDFHLGAFTNIWTLFLSTPRWQPDFAKRGLPFSFSGGLGMPSSMVGGATCILGVLGMVLQIFLYPPVHSRLGTLRSFRWFLLLFPMAYFLAPFLAVLPSSTRSPEPASGGFIWVGIFFLLLLHTTGRTMTLPASIILLNNCSPHPSVLGTIHGLGQSVSAGFRTVGPIVGGCWYGIGLNAEMVGFSWWAVGGMSALGWAAAMIIYEGSGHEIYLDGEEDDAEEL
ncbi:major facilitator superfamily domain-containing protein [Pseudomassariella vexata]|uniref:Major facilitator superfamily domain-containing protein n=1 Tax=Pseudomassariella vexata TaxID=1141098 RepID=A0A1Y2DSK2_9PEZI|nr:major facilitator superfamily domain-containing protein [Pseudomassariella vexata]ORY62134.1 major facilitator superfamily domain-containing protein [Pseudomassariella vexata]